jgi:hypothetical protein
MKRMVEEETVKLRCDNLFSLTREYVYKRIRAEKNMQIFTANKKQVGTAVTRLICI